MCYPLHYTELFLPNKKKLRAGISHVEIGKVSLFRFQRGEARCASTVTPAISEHQDTAMANNISTSITQKPIWPVRANKKSRGFYVQLVEGVHEAKERIELKVG
jgi:hypothetical protein